MKLAIVHDFLLSYGGAEHVLEHVHELYPDAPVYTLRHSPEMIHHRMDEWDIRTSLVERLPLLKKRGHMLSMPLYPLAMESFDFSGYDVVLSLSSAFAHGVITQPETTHICYYHTPTRFLWDYHFQYLKEKGWDRGVRGAAAQRFLHRLREWDYLAAQRPDIVLANSQTVADRITKFYRRTTDEIIFPGFNPTYPTHEATEGAAPYTLHPTPSSHDYYLTVSRLTPPKRIELAIKACTELGRPLHVVGVGEELDHLKSVAGKTIQFLGFMENAGLEKEYAGARALLWPGIDDFGLVPVEAMAQGRPAIAYNKGGATETVIHGKTGVLFDDQSVEGMKQGIENFEKIEKDLDPKHIHEHAQQFSKEAFQNKIKAVIEKAIL